MSTAIAVHRTEGSPFDAIRHVDESGVEFWMARELMPLLGYPRWSDFKPVIERAKISCENTGNTVTEHFSGLLLSSSGEENIRLSRCACYLTAMNGDPRKPEIAAAQAYFAVKTREAELAVQPKSPEEMLVIFANQALEHKRRMDAQDERLRLLEQSKQEAASRLEAIEAEQERYHSPSGRKFSVLAFANIHGLEMSIGEAGSKGRKASALCREKGIKLEKVYDPRFGTVGLYPESVLEVVFGEE